MIGCSASVTCLFQAYSAIWSFQSDGDIFAFQDGAPFARLGVTRKFTQSPVVQILPHSAGQFIIATKSGKFGEKQDNPRGPFGRNFENFINKIKFTGVPIRQDTQGADNLTQITLTQATLAHIFHELNFLICMDQKNFSR